MKEALRLALGALQRFIKYDYNENPFDGKDVEGAEAIIAIKAALAQPVQEQWNAALDEAAARIGEIKGFGQATQDSFAVYIKGLKK